MKNLFFVLVIVIVVGTIAKEAFFKKKEVYEPVACTMDAMQCPDGSYVSRVAPLCEFAKCPEVKVEVKPTTASIGQTVGIDGVSITPLKLVEDSRCPAGAYCYQEGTVKLQVELGNNGKKQKTTLTLNKPISFAGMKVSLKNVSPSPDLKTSIKESDYKFEFSVVSEKIEQV